MAERTTIDCAQRAIGPMSAFGRIRAWWTPVADYRANDSTGEVEAVRGG